MCAHAVFLGCRHRVCVCVWCTLPLCVFFFFSSRRCGMAFAGWLVSRLAPSAWFTRSCTRVNVCVCVCVCTTCGVAIGTLLLRDDSIAVRRPFKKGAVCCLLLSSLSTTCCWRRRVCVCVHNTHIYINACGMRAWAPRNKILLRAVGVSEWCKRDQTRLFIYLFIYLSILSIDRWRIDR